MEHDILTFKLLLTDLGIEVEHSAITPENLKKVMVDNKWLDVELLDLYEKAWVATHTLYRKLQGYGQ